MESIAVSGVTVVDGVTALAGVTGIPAVDVVPTVTGVPALAGITIMQEQNPLLRKLKIEYSEPEEYWTQEGWGAECLRDLE